MDPQAKFSTGSRGLPGRAAWLWLGGLVVAGIALRSFNFFEVFRPDAVVFPGQDPYYHMRRILLILESYPRVPLFDTLINHPFGAVAIWTPLFDLFVATVILLGGFGVDDVRSAEIIASWIVPVIGAATILPLYRLGRRLGGASVGLAAATFLTLAPAHIWYSRLGFVDHHAAVTLMQVVLVVVCMRACSPREGHAGWPVVAGMAACIVVGLLTWSGFLLFVVILDLFLMLRMIVFRDDRRVPRLVWMVHLPAAAALLPSAAGFVGRTGEPFTAITLSYFHVAAVAWFGLLGVVVDACRSRRYQRLPRPARLGLPVALAVVTLVFLARTSAWGEGLDWLLARDAFMGQVNESQPLLGLSRRGLSVRVDMPGMATILFPAAALAWLWLALRSWRPWRSDDAPRQLFLVWSGALLLAAVGQRRFLQSVAPAEAVLVALGLAGVVRAVWRSGPARSARRIVPVLGIALGLAVAYLPWHVRAFAPRDRDADAWLHRAIGGFHSRLVPPPAAPPRGEGPVFGALGPWYLGHRILYLTGLPVVANNFGSHIGSDSYRDWSAFFMAGEESAAVALLKRRNVRYVFVDRDLDFAQTAIAVLGMSVDEFFVVERVGGDDDFTPLEPYLKTMAFRLTHLRGTERSFLDRQGQLFTVPPLDHFRLVYEYPGRDPAESLKVYELVEGATLRIEGRPGEAVEVRYQETSESAPGYSKNLVVDDDGWARTIVPYPSDRPGLSLTGSYRVRIGERIVDQRVPDAAVQSGQVITVRPPA